MPLHKWGIDILGSFPLALRQLKYLIVTIGYFTKWIEAEPWPTITTEKVREFIWKRIVCRYGIPPQLVSDNGTQFTECRFEDFCMELGIVQLFSLVEHLQTKELAEATNQIILARLKKRLEKAYGPMSCMLYYGPTTLHPTCRPKKHLIDWCMELMQ